ncbi:MULTISPECIES: Tn3 family transposase [Alphaproteobacteria]|jgi:TnpA family transposase|uniref:Transposase n=72 Tax=Bacteria TaxID=2 RepID=A0A086P9K1_SPHHM|nr:MULTISPECIES: Tn3 family transposase [Alphaproteobacteria]EZP67564.1 Transposase [Sphingomonas paucimobilis]MAX16043.1 Tn3 family transposase [Sphingobium sp.]MBQ8104296.1 Tn3 family transposase [Afipia sp.]MCC6940770.1 Tn3 family transposase [Novosphingobium sp.]OAP32421.1 transposase [Sphingobium sp. 20006FA]ODU68802.1 MAG: transposase [Novosphingobium sp. SCN 66-18]|tara:strand:- start:104 stop:3073 length:2970 start_codon:yes stop_codon:yes gene_type:complete
MARRRLLTGDERRRLFDPPVQETAIIGHYTLSAEDVELVGRRYGPANRLGLAAQIALMRHPGFGLQPEIGLPDVILQYLAAQLFVDPSSFSAYGQRAQTRTDHADLVARYLGIRPFRRGDLALALNLAAQAAEYTDRGEPIVRALMVGLKGERFILPSGDTLERAGLAGRARARKAAAAAIVEGLSSAELTRLDELVINNPDFGMTPLAWLRNFEEAPTAANINGLLERLRYVRGIGIHPVVGGAIPEFRFAQFVREGGVAPAFLLSDYSVNRRRATLTAAVIDLEARLADAAIQMFDRLIGGMFTRARRGRERRYQDSIQSVGQLMRLFGATITALDEAVQNGGDPLELIDEAVGWHRLVAAKAQVDALADLAGEDALVTATERYATLRRFSPAFLDAFTFKASGTGTALIKAIDVIRDANTRKSRDLPDGVPLPFPNRQWKRLITESGRIDRRRYEIAIMATLRDRLRAGDVWIEGTRNYQRFDAYLLGRRDAAKVADVLPFDSNAASYLADRARNLDWRLRRFAKQLKTNKLEGVSLERDRLKLQQMPPVTPPEAEALDRKLDTLLPRVRITELLLEVAERTGFLNAFRDLRSGKEHDNPSTVLAAILADGTNLGLERMANASEGVSYAQLAWTHNWYLSPENYQAALAMIISAHHELPFARHWGAGTSSSSDGQFFRSGRSRSGAADVNAKYGAEPGVKIYSHLSDHFASFGSRIMSATAGEAPYVLDGLVLGAGNLPLHEHYTDTGGATDHVFALCHLLGFRFAPRLRDIGDRKLGSIAAPSTYKGIENLMGRTIKTAAIEADWDDIVRIVASIKDGTVAPSVILRKLAAYKRQNRLDFALAELGRIERTLFTLDWLEQPELRRACQAGLNKGEARHTLAAAIYTNRQGRFTDRSLENQEFRASGLNLLIAAISYWNTVYLDRAAQHLNAVGTTFDAALLAHLSPMGWAHISLTGDYLWEQARRLPAGEFHPLNEPMARLKRVA